MDLSSSGLKERLRRIFWSLSLLHSSCKPSTRSLHNDNVHQPVPILRNHHTDHGVDDRSREQMHALEKGMLKDLKTGKGRRTGTTYKHYETSKGERKTCTPGPRSSPLQSSHDYYCFKRVKEEETEAIRMNYLFSYGHRFTKASSMERNIDEGEFFRSEQKVRKEKYSKFYQSPLANANKMKMKKKKKKKKERISQNPPPAGRQTKNFDPSWEVREGFQSLASPTSSTKKKDGGQVKGEKRGFAVAKKSSDPYADFKSSMVEMITERHIFGADDLKCLLQSYLALNSHHHHPIILQAFSDVWVALFAH